MKIKLYRLPTTEDGTYGVLEIDGQPVCTTLEDSWKNNQASVSCIPPGKYNVVPHNSAKYKNVWRVEGVTNRSGILIHAGNTAADTTGCILVGSGFGKKSITRSQDALNMLRSILPDKFVLEIVEFHPQVFKSPAKRGFLNRFFDKEI